MKNRIYAEWNALLVAGFEGFSFDVSAREPAEPVALFIVNFFQQSNGTGSTVVSASVEDDLHQAHRRGVGITERGFD